MKRRGIIYPAEGKRGTISSNRGGVSPTITSNGRERSATIRMLVKNRDGTASRDALAETGGKHQVFRVPSARRPTEPGGSFDIVE
ncbi:hypothetical protein AB1N83_003467 [Pleurotus pulmonarius]